MSVEPRASLSLAMTLDTVVCRDLKELTAMKDNIRTADSGSSPLLKNTVQTFNIGGQEIVFPTELHECKAKYLGKDFYWAVIDTIYQTTLLRVPPKSIRKISPESSRKIPPKTAWQQTKPKVTTRKRK